RAFQRIKCLLSLLAAYALQPRDRGLLVRRAFGESESIGNDDERSAGSRMIHPAEILILLETGFDELAIRPVSHGVECDFAIHQFLHCLVPGQTGMIRIDIVLHPSEILHRRLHFGIVPFHPASEEVSPALRSNYPKQGVFEKLRGSPDPRVANA